MTNIHSIITTTEVLLFHVEYELRGFRGFQDLYWESAQIELAISNLISSSPLSSVT
ncbi:hypothetical protein J6590_045906 [Homalodisca vitripennis]|nr:hypothetical protein J6590_045906 [Homalodisca vitripennis]